MLSDLRRVSQWTVGAVHIWRSAAVQLRRPLRSGREQSTEVVESRALEWSRAEH